VPAVAVLSRCPPTSRGWARGSSAGRRTASRCRTTGWSTSPIVPTAACRCSRLKGSTSRRCSSTAPVRRRSRPRVWRSLPTRISSSSTWPTTRVLAHAVLDRKSQLLYQLGERSDRATSGAAPWPSTRKATSTRRGLARAARALRVQGAGEHPPPNAAGTSCRLHRAPIRRQPQLGARQLSAWASTMASLY
jgi:hypothetical protein